MLRSSCLGPAADQGVRTVTLPASFQAGTSAGKTCENVPWLGWGFMGITDKNSEVTIPLKCQSCEVWDAAFTLPGKVAKAFRYNAQPVAENLLRGREVHPKAQPGVFHRLVKGHFW